MQRLHEEIADALNLFQGSIEKMLRAETMEDWVLYKTIEGTPQGGVISPLLTNFFGNIINKEIQNGGYKFTLNHVQYMFSICMRTKKHDCEITILLH